MPHPIDSKFQRKRDHVILFCKGFAMGMANAVPGISGGTIAFLMGIYEDLIEAIKSFDLKFVRLGFKLRFRKAMESIPWRFLVFLHLGVIAAIIVLSRILSWLLVNKPVLIYAFFFGLICATIPIIARIVKPWDPLKVMVLLVSMAAAYWFVGLVPVSTPNEAWFLFLCGFVAISTMILPGISGAFVLVLLGKYQFILDAINHRDLMSLFVFGLGVVAGILSFVRALSWLFKKHHDMTLAIITGIVIGSLRKIWPWKEVAETLVTSKGKVISIVETNVLPHSWSGEVFLACLLMLAGFGLAMKMNMSSDGKILSK